MPPGGQADGSVWLTADLVMVLQLITPRERKEQTVLYYALIFLIVGAIAGALGAYGVASVASQIAWVLFVIGIILLIVHLVSGRRRVL